MRTWSLTGALVAGLVLVSVALWPSTERPAAAPGEHTVFVAMTGKNGVPPAPTPVPTAAPYTGPITSLYAASANLWGGDPIEVRYTHIGGDGRETFDDPTHPSRIAWYPDWGSGMSQPGYGGSNTVMAAHINYVYYGNAPFAYLTSADIGGALYLTMANGASYTYTIRSVEVVGLEVLDMNEVVFPALASNVERVTLISCGGTFVPNASGVGGHYNSRVVLVAERATG